MFCEGAGFTARATRQDLGKHTARSLPGFGGAFADLPPIDSPGRRANRDELTHRQSHSRTGSLVRVAEALPLRGLCERSTAAATCR